MSAKNLIIRGGADFSGVKKELDKTQKNLTSFQKGLGKTMVGIGALFGGIAIAVGATIKSAIQPASELESAMLGLQSILEAQGRSFTKANRFIQEYISDGLVPLTDAVTAYKNLTARGYNDEQIQQVMSQLKDAASFGRQSSYTLGEAVRSATEGLKNENSVLVDNAGVTKNVAKMWDEYARSIGKSRNELTQQEKIQAEVSGILKETQFQVGDAAKYTKTYAGRLAMLSKTLQDIKVTIGNALKPGAGAGLEGLIEQLSAIKSWAEENQAALQRWGQSIAGVVRTAIKGVSLMTGAITQNWQAIKFAGTTLLTYVAVTKGAAAATATWRIATLALKGELMTKVPVLTAVSTAIGTYRLQMALAPAATNIFTAALLRLRVALYAVHTALGPIGWAVLALSAAASGGMAMWNKYNQSLQKTTSLGFGDFRKVQDGVANSTGAAADAAEDQADAIEKAGKAAKKSLAGFDEIHQLQKDMAGGSGAGEDVLDEFDLGGIGGGIPGLDMGEMLNDIEQMKPTISGFWEWIKQGAGSIWDDWSNYVKSWGWVQTLSDWIVDTFFDAEEGVWSLKRTWQKWTDYVQSWGWVQGLTDWIVGVLEKWGDFKASAGETWENIKSAIKTKWNDLSTGAKSTWGNIKDTVQTSWNNLKKDAPATWESIKSTISTKANNARDALTKTWAEVSKRTTETWASIKTSTGTVWESIKTSLAQTWSGIQTSTGNALTTMRNTITTAWNNLRSTTQTAWNNIKSAITSPVESAKRTLSGYINDIKNAFANMRITIPKPKLPHISVSTKTKTVGGVNIPYPDFDINWYAQGGIFNGPSMIGVGEAGAEAVLPLERNTGWMDTLAAKIAASIPGGPAGGDIYVYVGNEQVDAYVYRSQDRRNTKSNGR
jgi:hypothetical protein